MLFAQIIYPISAQKHNALIALMISLDTKDTAVTHILYERRASSHKKLTNFWNTIKRHYGPGVVMQQMGVVNPSQIVAVYVDL